ncbi:MAG: glycerol-3-phosphate 1-O-acyltransferase PlsY [Rhodanobacteraceae bacterium]|nr:glycerol-3-phosphate 1-O-acyltransferase PlsY [Rhodanobacteraceae bacterium]HPF74022.1 glycerol-3-phosphate 1-O-acyltransferase PlsY [Xanthomonadaceae bacterium]HRX99760.1 glycerol-3-phosphate 1-O-acyltransferase PlsY [Xanthomonadaceae bacterium]
MPALLALLICAYLLGSLSGSLLLGRFRGVDIRTQGSGNAGGTNAFRTQGWRFALGVLLIDVGKGALAAWLARHWPWPMVEVSPWLTTAWLAVLAAVAGHIWPLFHGFRGGKGVGTLLGGLLLVWPLGVGVFLGVWLLVLVSSGYVGLASVLAALSLPLAAIALPGAAAHLFPAVLTAALITFTHRQNIRRLAAGNEHRFERIRLLRRRT